MSFRLLQISTSDVPCSAAYTVGIMPIGVSILIRIQRFRLITVRQQGPMSRKVNFAIAVLAAVAVFLLFVSSGEPLAPYLRDSQLAPILYVLSWPNTIVFNLSVGYLSSTIFWILVVYLPDKSRRSLLRETLATRYNEFKYEIVQTFIWAAGESLDTQSVEDLACDHIKFKEYFSNDRWYAVLNGIQGSELRMHELHLAMKMFADEVAYVLNNVAIDDPHVHRVFKRLNESIFRLRESETDLYDQVKYVGNFLWGVLARWSLVEGQLEDDIVEIMITRI